MNWIDIIAAPLLGFLAAYLAFQLLSCLAMTVINLIGLFFRRVERGSSQALLIASILNLILYSALSGLAYWLVFNMLNYRRIMNNPLFLAFAVIGSLLMLVRIPLQFRIFWHVATVRGFLVDFQRGMEDFGTGANIFSQRNSALRTMIKLVQQGPKSKSATLSFHLTTGLNKVRADRSHEAIADFNRAVKLDSQNAHVYFGRGMAYERIKKLPLALGDYSKAIKLRPENPTFHYARGIVKALLDDSSGAIGDYSRALELGYEPRQLCLARRGFLRCKLEDFKGAIDDLTDAIAREPENYEHHYYRALAKSLLEDFPGAIADITVVIERLPDNALPYQVRGGYRFNTGDYRDAIEDFTRAIERNPGQAEIFFMRGLARQRLKDFAGALEDFKKNLEANPGNAFYWRLAGNTRLALKDHAGAIADYSKAIELHPDDPVAHRSRAEARAAGGDPEGALEDRLLAGKLGKENEPDDFDPAKFVIRQQL